MTVNFTHKSVKTRGLTRSWNKIVEELDKCVLLCANCHREVHSGLAKIEKKDCS